MDNNYFDFLGQNSVASNDDSNTGSSNDKGKVNLTVRVDADCQVVCDGDFLFLANANQIVKDKAPMGQHIFNFTSLDFPEATVEKIVDFPVEGNNYLIVVNDLKEKIGMLQEEIEADKAERLRQEKEKERMLDLEEAMSHAKSENYTLAMKLFDKHVDSLNDEQQKVYTECKKKQEEKDRIEYEKTHDIDFSVNGVTFKMIYVKGGVFSMEDDYERDSKLTITLSDYHLGETQVTQALWKAVMGNNPSYFKGSDHPVEKVSWNDCLAFVEKLNQITGRCFGLPTEAQWEYAARGGNESKGYKYSGSDNEDVVAWYFDNSGDSTHPVKTKKANELGLFDMSGNVGEWCMDAYLTIRELKKYYGTEMLSDPEGPETEVPYPKYIVRGSSYSANTHRSIGYRNNIQSPCSRFINVGFRLVLINEEKMEKQMQNWRQERDLALQEAQDLYNKEDYEESLVIFENLVNWLNDEYLDVYKNCKKKDSERKKTISELDLAEKLWKEANHENWSESNRFTSYVDAIRLEKYEKIVELLVKNTQYLGSFEKQVLDESRRLIDVLAKKRERDKKIISELQKADDLWEEAKLTNWPESERYSDKVRHFRLYKYVEMRDLLEKNLPVMDERKIKVPLGDGYYSRDYFTNILNESYRLIPVLSCVKR